MRSRRNPPRARAAAAAPLLAVLALTSQDPADDVAQVKVMLADLHRAASEAAGDRYFAHLDPAAILFGTDATERWTVDEFGALVRPVFAQRQGWTTMPTEQHVYLSGDGQLAWFDERLESSKYGAMRGTGVAWKTGDRWRIVHFNTAFVVPNEVFRDLVTKIAEKPRATYEATPPPSNDTTKAVAAALVDFHDAAAKADRKRYFDHFAPGAIYFGTDSTERFTVVQLEAYVGPYLDRGEGWTTVPTQQNVYLSGDGAVAWFDERLQSTRHGEMRGSGVMVRVDGRWKIAQYNLTLPIPNELVPDLLALRGQQRPK